MRTPWVGEIIENTQSVNMGAERINGPNGLQLFPRKFHQPMADEILRWIASAGRAHIAMMTMVMTISLEGKFAPEMHDMRCANPFAASRALAQALARAKLEQQLGNIRNFAMTETSDGRPVVWFESIDGGSTFWCHPFKTFSLRHPTRLSLSTENGSFRTIDHSS